MSVLIGNIIKVKATFKDEDGDVQDPTTVQVRVKNPSASVTTYVYGTDPEVVRTSKGVYYIEIDTIAQPGTFEFVWNSTGNYQAAGQTEFTVVDTLF
jgi:flagellar hook assembly protein FlgD